jgi:hypothetical protein
MSRYTRFTKRKHLIFLNGGSIKHRLHGLVFYQIQDKITVVFKKAGGTLFYRPCKKHLHIFAASDYSVGTNTEHTSKKVGTHNTSARRYSSQWLTDTSYSDTLSPHRHTSNIYKWKWETHNSAARPYSSQWLNSAHATCGDSPVSTSPLLWYRLLQLENHGCHLGKPYYLFLCTLVIHVAPPWSQSP